MADGKKLSSLDASFLYLETPEMPMHVGSMAIFRLPDGYKGGLLEDFKRSPRLRRPLHRRRPTSSRAAEHEICQDLCND